MSNSKNTSVLLISIATLVLIYGAVLSTVNFFGAPKVAYIDSMVLMEKYPSAITAREELNKKNEEWGQNTKTLETELQELNKEMMESSGKWSKKETLEKNETYKKKQMEYVKYSRAIQEKSAKLEQELFAPVYVEINSTINDFGKENGLDIILGTLSGGNILYAKDASNLTDEFLEYVEEN